MKQVIKYQLTTGETQVISMPSGAAILGAFTDKDSNSLQLLAAGDLNVGLIDHTIYVRAVGTSVDDIPARDSYIGTYQEEMASGISGSYTDYGVWDGGE